MTQLPRHIHQIGKTLYEDTNSFTMHISVLSPVKEAFS